MKNHNSYHFSFSSIDYLIYIVIPSAIFLIGPVSQIYFVLADALDGIIQWDDFIARLFFTLFLEYFLFQFSKHWEQKYGCYSFDVTSDYLVVHRMMVGVPLKIRLSWDDIFKIEKTRNMFGDYVWVVHAKYNKKRNKVFQAIISSNILNDDTLVKLIQNRIT